ncbi:hypothetical protein T484DRAFT_1940190 [Baffinella frigidus]|nr:hypothetical protein T484DRAFT_1940190 [Cryptophyta sp. CCMP2293]
MGGWIFTLWALQTLDPSLSRDHAAARHDIEVVLLGGVGLFGNRLSRVGRSQPYPRPKIMYPLSDQRVNNRPWKP